MLQISFFIKKLKKRSNSANTAEKVMILSFCISSDGPLSMYQVSINFHVYFVYFQRYAPDKFFSLQQLKKEVTP